MTERDQVRANDPNQRKAVNEALLKAALRAFPEEFRAMTFTDKIPLLSYFVCKKDVEVLTWMFRRGADADQWLQGTQEDVAAMLLAEVAKEDANHVTALIWACMYGLQDVVDLILALPGSSTLLTKTSTEGFDAFHYAVWFQNLSLIDSLLRAGADPGLELGIKSKDLQSPSITPFQLLMLATVEGQNALFTEAALVQVAEKMQAKRADVASCASSNGKTALHYAVENNKLDLAWRMVTEKKWVPLTALDDDTLWTWTTTLLGNLKQKPDDAVSLERVIAVLQATKTPGPNAENQTAFMFGCQQGLAPNVLEALLKLPSQKIDHENKAGKTALAIAVDAGRLPVLDLVLAKLKATPASNDSDRQRRKAAMNGALQAACQLDPKSKVKNTVVEALVLKGGASLNTPLESHLSALAEIVKKGQQSLQQAEIADKVVMAKSTCDLLRWAILEGKADPKIHIESFPGLQWGLVALAVAGADANLLGVLVEKQKLDCFEDVADYQNTALLQVTLS